MINAAYALGANSYLPKDPEGMNLVVSLESFYKCWLENVQLPRTTFRDRVQEALDRATGLRVRTSEFYLNLARSAADESEVKLASHITRHTGEGELHRKAASLFDRARLLEIQSR